MKHDINPRRLATVWALLLVLVPALASAQDVTVRGRVLGPDNAPLADQRVVLHRVDGTGGATIAEAVSAADGGFELAATVPPDTGAVYFVAARYDEELYIGPPFRPDDGSATDQVIQVGVPAMSATSMLAETQEGFMPPPRRPEPTRGWMLLAIPLLGVIGVAAYALIPRNSIPRDRQLLRQVAELDERLATAPDAQKVALLEERRQLVAQLSAD